MSLLETILDLIEEVKPGLRPDPDEELIKSGRLDSVEIMSLVMALTGGAGLLSVLGGRKEER